MDHKKVLLLTPHSMVGNQIEDAFVKSDFDVVRTEDVREMLGVLKRTQPHAVIVDWDLTNGTMKEVIKHIRENCKKTGLVLLSNSHGSEDRIQALKEGADDCVPKTPEVEELVAKVNALIRRIDLAEHAPQILRIKDIVINLDTHEVWKDNKLIEMTYTQFKLLYLLASRRDYVFSRDEILEKVWGENSYVTNRTVDVHVKRLREKLGEKKSPSEYILTIHGLGYRFV